MTHGANPDLSPVSKTIKDYTDNPVAQQNLGPTAGCISMTISEQIFSASVKSIRKVLLISKIYDVSLSHAKQFLLLHPRLLLESASKIFVW